MAGEGKNINDPSRIYYYNYSGIDPECKSVDSVNRARPDDRPIVRDFSLFLVIITTIYVVFTLSKFYYYRSRYVHLKKRSFLIVFTSGIGALCQVYGNSLWLATDYACFVKVVLFMFVVPFLTMGLPIRMLEYYNNHVFARKLLIALREKERRANEAYSFDSESDGNNKIQKMASISAISDANKTSIKRMESSSQDTTEEMRQLRILKFLTSIKMKFILIFIVMFPNMVALAYDLSNVPHLNPKHQCRGCYLPSTTVIVLLVGGAGMTVLGIVLALMVRKYPDPFGIVSELTLASIFGGLIAVSGFILDWMAPTFQNFTFGWIILLGCVNILFITSDYQVHKAIASEKKYESRASDHGPNTNASQVQHDTATSVVHNSETGYVQHAPVEKEQFSISNLRKVLENRVEAEYFEEHLVSEFSVELIRMYLECQNFKKHFHDMTEKTRRARARRIVETYVVSSALSQVNLSDALRTTLIQKAEDTSKEISSDIFKESDFEILRMMLGSYLRFMKTDRYREMQHKLEKTSTSSPSSLITRSMKDLQPRISGLEPGEIGRADSMKKGSPTRQPKVKP